jgi:hypothetical protein
MGGYRVLHGSNDRHRRRVQIAQQDMEATKVILKLERTLYKGLSIESDKV